MKSNKPTPRKKRRKSRSEHYTTQNRVELVRGGKPYFDCLLKMIADAQESIHLQTYIYEDDHTGQLVAAALKDAARRKVQVYMLADGYASKKLSRELIRDLKEAGVHFRFFDPLLKSRHFYFGRRLHRKVVVVDATSALVGGVNVTDRYNDMPDQPAWLDFGVYIEGEAAGELCELCRKSWSNYLVDVKPVACTPQSFRIAPDKAAEVSMRRNDWVRNKNEISSTYINMFRSSRSHITILCSYFLPGRIIRRQLVYAARRGVKIRVITAGFSDVMLSKYAERYLYNWLLRHNIGLYEYQPNVLHGKIAVCDSQWVTIGSYNINDISAYASIELNMNVKNARFAEQAETTLQQIMDKDCVPITREYQTQTHNIFKQFGRWFSYEFIRAVFFLFTFYYKRRAG